MERFTDPEEAIAFIDKIQEKMKMNKEAFVLFRVLVGKVKLHKYNQLKETKNIIKEAEMVLDEIDGVVLFILSSTSCAATCIASKGNTENFTPQASNILAVLTLRTSVKKSKPSMPSTWPWQPSSVIKFIISVNYWLTKFWIL